MGNVVARGATSAVGAEVYGSGDIHIGGDVHVYSTGETFGVGMAGVGGYAFVGGNLVAVSSGAGKAAGFYGNVTGDVALHVGENVYAKSVSGQSFGVVGASSGGNVSLYVGGDVYSGSSQAGAAGAIAEAAQADITIDGNVLVHAYTTGIGVETYGLGNIHVGGDVDAFSAGEATASGWSGTGGYAYVGGNVVAVSSNAGNASGFYGNVSGDLSAHIGGNIYAKAANGPAFGVAGISNGGKVTLYVAGDVYAGSPQGGAGGVLAQGEQTDITVMGNVLARGNATAIGVEIYAGSGNIHIGGDVGAFAQGNATGIGMVGVGGAAYVGGNLVAVSSGAGDASGFYGNVAGNVSVHVGGDVYAKTTTGNATGVLEVYNKSGVYNADLYVGGNVVAISSQGVAIGAKVAEFGNISVTINGNVMAHGYAEAIGLELGGIGNGVTRVGGDVYAYSTHGHSTGVLDVAGYVYVHGNVTAFSSDGIAAGFYAESLGNVSAHIDGSVFAQTGANQAAGVGSSGVNSNIYVGGDVEARSTRQAFGAIVEDTESTTLDIQGNVLAVGNLLAVGMYAKGPDVSIDVGGNVKAYSDTGAGGIHFTGAGYAYVGGSIVAVAGSGGDGAVGFAGTATGDIGLHVGQDVYAKTDVGTTIGVYVSTVANYNATLFVGGSIVAKSASGGTAVGVEGHATGGTFSLQTDGDVYSSSADNQAAGVGVISVGGDIDIDIGGNLVGKGQGDAFGGAAQTTGNISFAVGGDVVATSATGNATGMETLASGFNHVAIGGDVTALGYTGATGIVAESPGDVSVSVAGNVMAIASHSGDAIGVEVAGDASIYIGGNAIAISAAGNATGATMTSTGDAYVTVHQNVYAKGATIASGVYNYGYDHTSVTVGGDVTALAGTGNATGVFAHSKYGSAYISVGGDVTAISTQAKTYGVTAAGPLGAYANVTGNVTVEGPGTAVGVSSVGTGYAEATVGGNVYAGSVVGSSRGRLRQVDRRRDGDGRRQCQGLQRAQQRLRRHRPTGGERVRHDRRQRHRDLERRYRDRRFGCGGVRV